MLLIGNKSFYEITSPAASLPITLAEAKAYLRVTNSADDDIINSLIEAATNILEVYTGRTFVTTTYRGWFSNFEVSKLECWYYLDLMRSPLQSVSAFEELVDGSWTAFTSTEWSVRELSGFSRIIVDQTSANLPTYDDLEPYIYRADFVVGYNPVPEAIKTAIKVVVNYLYSNRGDCGCDCGGGSLIPAEAKLLVNKYRIKRAF